MKYINNITEAIGKTPLLKLNRIGRDVSANIFVKLEHLNPSGSYKDRMALAMVEAAEKGQTWNGRTLQADGTVLEASAGNTAPALAMVCAAKGYKAKFVLYRYTFESDTNSRMLITRAYGPEVAISSDPTAYMNMTMEEIEEFSKEEPDLPHVLAAKKDCAVLEEQDAKSVWIDQIYNLHNYEGQKSMAREVFEQLDGKIDAVGCSVASGGVLYALCAELKALGARPKITFGAVPTGSECYLRLDKEECRHGEFKVSTERARIAEVMGLDKWVTEQSIIHRMVEDGYPDVAFKISDEDARDMADRLCREEGIYCGMSSGANVLAALKVAQRLGDGANVVTAIVDSRDRYMSEIPHEKYTI